MNKIITIFLIASLYSLQSNGCTCFGKSTEEYIRDNPNNYIIEGTVEEIIDVYTKFGSRQITNIRVNRYWGKYDLTDMITVFNQDAGTCAYYFEQDSTYLIFADHFSNYLTTDMCTPTKKLSEANDDLTLLGRPKKPKKLERQALTTEKQPTNFNEWILGLLLTSIALNVILLIRRRTDHNIG